MEWPVDILAQLLGWLAWDGASVTFQHLAYLTINSSALIQAALKVQRPLVLEVEVDESHKNEFVIPCVNAHIVNIKIDWGDGKQEYVKQSREDDEEKAEEDWEPVSWSLLHTYANDGEYVVRVSPADRIGPVWLDHLGFGESSSKQTWWRPLRAVRSLGALGIRSLLHVSLRPVLRSAHREVERLQCHQHEVFVFSSN
jgi:hypothetical protein